MLFSSHKREMKGFFVRLVEETIKQYDFQVYYLVDNLHVRIWLKFNVLYYLIFIPACL